MNKLIRTIPKVALLLIIVSCNAQKNINSNNVDMRKKIDVDLLKEKAEKTPLLGENRYDYIWEYDDNDGLHYKIFGNEKDGFVEWLTPPLPLFYKEYSEFYGNGELKLTGKLIGSTRIGIWKYYDEQGNKEKEKTWSVSVMNDFYVITNCVIDGKTGEIISTKTRQGGYE